MKNLLSAVAVGGTEAGDDAAGIDSQAAAKTIARISTMMCGSC
jgi:hypothetical protein